MPRIFDNIEQQLINALQETMHVSNRAASVKFYVSTDKKKRKWSQFATTLPEIKKIGFIVRERTAQHKTHSPMVVKKVS